MQLVIKLSPIINKIYKNIIRKLQMEKLEDHTLGQNYNTRLSSVIFMVLTSTVGSIIKNNVG